MNWIDEGFLISKNRYSENSLIAEIYTKDRGKISGIIFGGTSKKIKNYLQIGNRLHVNYSSKSDNRIGYFKVEILNAHSPLYFDHKQKLSCITSAINLIKILTADSQSNIKVYQIIENLFLILNDKDWLNFFETDIDKIVQQDKIVFLDITADWCATCQFNKINVLDSNTVNKAFKDNNVTLIRADWTKPSTKINLFLEKYDRFGIPFNAFFSVNFPDGILLSELLSEKDILKTINQINNE